MDQLLDVPKDQLLHLASSTPCLHRHYARQSSYRYNRSVAYARSPHDDPDPYFAEFPKQEQAFKHIEQHPSMRMVVFSYEKGYQGPKGTTERIYRYVATTYDEFWTRYKQMEQRFYYEVYCFLPRSHLSFF